MYTGAIAILVESSALYSALGIMYLVPYSMGVPIADLFGQLWTKTSVSYQKVSLSISGLTGIYFVSKKVISPLLIILRVVKGRAWTAHITATSRTSLAFATQTPTGTRSVDGSTTVGDTRPQFVLQRLSKSSTSTTG